MEPDGIPTNSNGFHRIPTDPNGFHWKKDEKVGKCWKKSEIYDPTLAFSETLISGPKAAAPNSKAIVSGLEQLCRYLKCSF